jgi:hypothetical protein
MTNDTNVETHGWQHMVVLNDKLRTAHKVYLLPLRQREYQDTIDYEGESSLGPKGTQLGSTVKQSLYHL